MPMPYEDFVKHLETNYPEMYKNVYCGISIDDGWQHIIDKLSNTIYSHYKFLIQRGEAAEYPTVAQIKEKFGGLRFYYDGGDEYISGMVRMAESWAGNTCEECGVPGELRMGGWIRTLCDHHEAERQRKINETTV